MKIRIQRLDTTGHSTMQELNTEDAAAVAEAERYLQAVRRKGQLPYMLDDAKHGQAVLSVREATSDIFLTPAQQGG